MRTAHLIPAALVLFAVSLPLSADAQGRAMGAGGSAPPPSRGPQITARDIERFNPVAAVVAKRKELDLTDDQLTRLEAIRAKLAEENAPLLRQLDSVRRAMQTDSRQLTEEQRQRTASGRLVLNSTMQRLRMGYQVSGREALGLLNEEQRTKTMALLEKLGQDAEEHWRSRMR
jgi:hypothetical protein